MLKQLHEISAGLHRIRQHARVVFAASQDICCSEN